MLDELTRAKPASAKGRYLKAVTGSSTMGPGVKLDPTATRLDEHAVGVVVVFSRSTTELPQTSGLHEVMGGGSSGSVPPPDEALSC